MHIVVWLLFCILIPYLLGSLSFSIIVTRLFYRKDIRTFGSGNAGMTNVLRTFGKGAAALTLICDIGKGILAVLLAKMVQTNTVGIGLFGIYLAAFFAILGHVYPAYFGFKGGKAISVGAGTIIAINPALFIPFLILFLIVFFCGKMVSLASVCCAAAYPVITFIYYYFIVGHDTLMATLGAAVMAILVIWLHRGNLQRIKDGTEYKFLQKKT